MSYEQAIMPERPYQLSSDGRKIVLDTIVEVARYRSWHLYAAHVRSNHVHLVAALNKAPMNAIGDFKAYASRRLVEHAIDTGRKRRWAYLGNASELITSDSISRAAAYVVDGQGPPMSVYVDPVLRQLTPANPGHRADALVLPFWYDTER